MTYPPSGPFQQAIKKIPLMKVTYQIGLFIRNFMRDADRISARTFLRRQEEVFDDFTFSESFEAIMLLFMLSRYDYLDHIDRHQGYLITDKLLDDFPELDNWRANHPEYDGVLADIGHQDQWLEILFRRQTWLDQGEVISLDLSDLLIAELTTSQFRQFTELTELHLNNNLLYTLPEDIFQSMTNLESLDLSHNLISTLPIHIFANNQHLQVLDISYNGLDHTWLDKFRALNRLSHGRLEIIV